MKELLESIKDYIDELKTNNEYLEEIQNEKEQKVAEIKQLESQNTFLSPSSLEKKDNDKIIKKLNEKAEELNNTLKGLTEEIQANVNEKKQIMRQQIEDEIEKYKPAEEFDIIQEEINKNKKEKEELEKKASDAKKEYELEIEKSKVGMSTGNPVSSISRISKLRDQEKEYLKQIEDLDSKIEEGQKYILFEENREDYKNLEYLLSNVNAFNISTIGKFEAFVEDMSSQYKTEEIKQEEIKEEEEKEEKEKEEVKEEEIKEDEVEEAEKQEEVKETEVQEDSENATPEIDTEIQKEAFNPEISKEKKNKDLNYQNIELNEHEFYNVQNDYKPNIVNSKILVNLKDRNLQYSYENIEQSAKEYDIMKIKESINRIKAEYADVYDPFLRKFLTEHKDNYSKTAILNTLNYAGNLEALSDRIIYNMAGAEELGFKARRQLRKMVKLVNSLGLKVENEESVKFSFKNDILKGLGNLFKGAMKGLSGKADQLLIEDKYQYKMVEEELQDDEQEKNEEVQKNPNIDRLGNNTKKTEEDVKREKIEKSYQNNNTQQVSKEQR